jgi:hypothetical protein
MTVVIVHRREVPQVQAQTGLLFPSNGSPSDSLTTRFKFTSTAMPDPFPATYIWKFRPDQQTGYYTTFFHGPDGTSLGECFPAGTDGYYGCHPYPPGGSSGTTHKWEVACEANDFQSTEDVVKDVWYTQAAIVQEIAGNELQIDFYWDLATSSSFLQTRQTANDYALTFPPSNGSPCLTFGCAPWQPNVEMLSGVLRGLQIYSAALSVAQVQARMDLTSDTAVVSANPGSLWYCNLNPTPSDIADKSGAGHHPAWHNANRPTLWTP